VSGDTVMPDFEHIMIYGELADGNLASITKELLNGGKKLADSLGEELHVLFVGNGVTGQAREALAFGADKAYVVDDSRLDRYEGESYAAVLAQVVEKMRPRILLFGNTETGADLGPRLAFRRQLPVTTDCVALEVDREAKTLLRTKPVYGGLAMAVLASDGFPQIATVRPKSMSPAEKAGPVAGEPVPLDVDMSVIAPRVRVLERTIEQAKGVRLEDAEIIVSGGRGMGGLDGFKELEEVGRLLNGTVGGSRVAVDNGWIPTSLQVGLTGTIVAPRVYIAVGISGASQHMTGCARSQRIIAINKDATAPIFKQAHFGVVGDWKTVLPAFIEKLKELG
jgi:electron transfer flavoprotein alpha subunit